MNKVNALEFHLPLNIDFLGLSYLISPFSFIVRWSAPLHFLIISNMRISTKASVVVNMILIYCSNDLGFPNGVHASIILISFQCYLHHSSYVLTSMYQMTTF